MFPIWLLHSQRTKNFGHHHAQKQYSLTVMIQTFHHFPFVSDYIRQSDNNQDELENKKVKALDPSDHLDLLSSQHQK